MRYWSYSSNLEQKSNQEITVSSWLLWAILHLTSYFRGRQESVTNLNEWEKRSWSCKFQSLILKAFDLVHKYIKQLAQDFELAPSEQRYSFLKATVSGKKKKNK